MIVFVGGDRPFQIQDNARGDRSPLGKCDRSSGLYGIWGAIVFVRCDRSSRL
ncbi:hypothetical protein VB712_14055 [Spirulina sp. CCNP1310]|uniref:hypothetical protein n=1 Tax=Spirulina sp. CCNP1310 TaxID=3110249 RepID=UPI002B1ED3B6|nr:hypothetical protein [Spirulina sp. CCNP1310]MEA5420351.1 hypothetical protein [Spirulina sp. CCNP1310]